MLCIRRTFADGRAAGVATGLGAATADAFYGAVAGFGLTAISAFLLDYQDELRVAGGVFLLALGARTAFTKPSTASARAQHRAGGLPGAWATTALLTLSNPATILSFAAVFAGAGLAQQAHGAGEALAIVTGVFLGSAAWWVILSQFVERYRRKHPEFASLADHRLGGAVVTGVTLGVASRTLKRINQVSGALLGAFGLAALASVL